MIQDKRKCDVSSSTKTSHQSFLFAVIEQDPVWNAITLLCVMSTDVYLKLILDKNWNWMLRTDHVLQIESSSIVSFITLTHCFRPSSSRDDKRQWVTQKEVVFTWSSSQNFVTDVIQKPQKEKDETREDERVTCLSVWKKGEKIKKKTKDDEDKWRKMHLHLSQNLVTHLLDSSCFDCKEKNKRSQIWRWLTDHSHQVITGRSSFLFEKNLKD